MFKVLKNVLIRLAQRYSGDPVTTEELEDIYELTYKYQMLNQEQALGDYGYPQPLPDRAYMALHNITPALDNLLEEVREKIADIYDEWILGHEPDEYQIRDMAVENANSWLSEANLNDFIVAFGEDAIKEAIVDVIDDEDLYDEVPGVGEAEDYKTEEDTLEFRRRYLEQLEPTAQRQKVLPLEPGAPEWEEPKFPTAKENLATLDVAAFEDIFDTYQDEILEKIVDTDAYDAYINSQIEYETEMLYEDSPLGEVKDMRTQLGEGWEDKDVGEKVILFQVALNTMHNSGDMAEYVLADSNAVDILDAFSAGEGVDQWDRELSKLLGYEPGSKLQSDQPGWYTPGERGYQGLAALGKLISMGRSASIATDDLEDIYELTYKRQVLEQEEALGAYGIPQILPDPAYMEKHRLDPRLEGMLDNAQEEMMSVYGSWIADHYEYAIDAMKESVYENEMQYIRQMSMDEAERHFGEEKLLEAITYFADDEIYAAVKEEILEEEEAIIYKEPEEEPEISFTDEWMKYLEKIKEKTGQRYQRELQFDEDWPEESEISDKTLHEVVKERIEELTLRDDIIMDTFDRYRDDIMNNLSEDMDMNEDYLREQAEEYADEWLMDSAYPGVVEMKDKLEDEWDVADLGEKIILFQEALTTMHNNGEMAEYLLQDRSAVQILDDLSSGPDVDDWNRDLARMLGYEPGSRLKSYHPEYSAPLTGLAKVIAFLGELYEEETNKAAA